MTKISHIAFLNIVCAYMITCYQNKIVLDCHAIIYYHTVFHSLSFKCPHLFSLFYLVRARRVTRGWWLEPQRETKEPVPSTTILEELYGPL